MKNILNKIYGVFMVICTWIFISIFWLNFIPNILINCSVFGIIVAGMMIIGMFCSTHQAIEGLRVK